VCKSRKPDPVGSEPEDLSISLRFSHEGWEELARDVQLLAG
jgi:hypothetical protein